MKTYLDASEPYAALRLSARNRKRIAAAVAAKPKQAAQPVAPAAKAAARKPAASDAHFERAARRFVALVQPSAPKPAAAATGEPAKSDPGNWKAAHARAAGKAVLLDTKDENHGWTKIMAKLNRSK